MTVRSVQRKTIIPHYHWIRDIKMKTKIFVVTIRTYRKETPNEVRKSKTRLYGTVLLKSGKSILATYQDKSNKSVLLVSTFYPNLNVESQNTKKFSETEPTTTKQIVDSISFTS